MKKLSTSLSIFVILSVLTLGFVIGCTPPDDPVVPVSSISMSQTTAALEVGGTISLSATVSPSNATEKEVTWSSSNTSVATVSNGVVKAVGEGSANITASAGGKSAVCQVNVSPARIPVTGISLDLKEATIYVGETLTLVATVSPADATEKSVAWTTDDPKVATVDPKGVVTAVGPGTCTITAQSGDFSAKCTVTCIQGGQGFPEGEMPADTEVWYTTSDGKALTNVNNQGASTLKSNKYNTAKGYGVLQFSGAVKDFVRLTDSEEESQRLTGILIPDCVETIGNNILLFSDKVTEFRIPASLKEVGSASFVSREKANLERFTGHHVSQDGRLVIIDGVLYGFAPVGVSSYEVPAGVVKLVDGVFARTPELKSIVLPAGLETIGDMCFQASGLESVTIPASVKQMAHYAFKECFELRNLLGDSHFISADRKFLYDRDCAWAPMILTFFAGKDESSYTIPEGIRHIENYSFEGCKKLRSLTVPESMEGIGVAFDGCDNLESLNGKYATSDHKGLMNKDHELMVLLPNIDADYVIPDEVTRIGDKVFYERENLRSVTMGDQVTSIGAYAFAHCTSLKTLTLSANLRDFGGWNPIMGCGALEAVYFRSLIPPFRGDLQMTNAPKMKFYVPSRTFSIYTNNVDWKQYWDIMKSYDYTDLPEPDFYISSDYSAEGEVTVYQKASEGRGIDLVVMGDAYSDREVASGKYLKDMKAIVEQFFAIEPYKPFRNLFNIYFVTTVSATEGFERGGQSLGSALVGGSQITGNDPKCFEMARKAVKDDERMQEVLVLICGNQPDFKYYAGTAYMYDPDKWVKDKFASGPSLVYFTKLDDSFERTGVVLRHECGHGFGKLLDEYFYDYTGPLPKDRKEQIVSYSANGWYANIDVTPDPAKVKWSAFLADERYKYDELGVFEGGDTHATGAWRPSLTSIMDNNEGRFNAPSRYAIWKRIHKLAFGTDVSYEDFVAYDAVNRKTSASAPTASRMTVQKQQKTSAPVVTGRSWRKAEWKR
ncbi:MAG: leucine-rich repeat protein [Bacteroidales bacterium]|nr:leucine-rich repeat protein [Bacteroidales bacterium]